MYNDEEFDLTLEERAALASLPREMSPGNLLEEKVVRALRDEGRFGVTRSRGTSFVAAAWKVAAAITLFAGGVATGRYVLKTDSPASASITAPASLNRGAEKTTPRTEPRPVRQNESVVAVREMWL